MSNKNLKKSAKCKFITEDLNDFLSDERVSLNNMANKTNIKRRGNTEKDFRNFAEMKPPAAKKHNSNEIDACAKYRQKILNLMCHQLEVRKQIDDNLIKNYSDVITKFEADNDVFNENKQELERLTGLFMKCFQQATTAHKDKLNAFQSVLAAFKKECVETEVEEKADVEKLGEEIKEDIQKLKHKLISETKRNEWKHLQKAEGLLLRGAMKPDDRPLWLDVYRAFPPIEEPKFARPKPETKPIKQILYKEDIVRAKFHAKNQGLNVNMISLTGETQIKKLVEKYKQLQSEGLPQEDLIQKAVEAVGIERQTESPKVTPINPESVSAKVLAQADIKNIFKE